MKDFVSRATGHRRPSAEALAQVSSIRRVIGEGGLSGMSTRSDARPPKPKTEPVGLPDPVPAESEADLLHQQGRSDEGMSALDTVLTMWRNGLKTEACQHMLFSDFSYSDFARFVHSLSPEEAAEAGEMLDRMAPDSEDDPRRTATPAADRQADLEAEGRA